MIGLEQPDELEAFLQVAPREDKGSGFAGGEKPTVRFSLPAAKFGEPSVEILIV